MLRCDVVTLHIIAIFGIGVQRRHSERYLCSQGKKAPPLRNATGLAMFVRPPMLTGFSKRYANDAKREEFRLQYAHFADAQLKLGPIDIDDIEHASAIAARWHLPHYMSYFLRLEHLTNAPTRLISRETTEEERALRRASRETADEAMSKTKPGSGSHQESPVPPATSEESLSDIYNQGVNIVYEPTGGLQKGLHPQRSDAMDATEKVSLPRHFEAADAKSKEENLSPTSVGEELPDFGDDPILEDPQEDQQALALIEPVPYWDQQDALPRYDNTTAIDNIGAGFADLVPNKSLMLLASSIATNFILATIRRTIMVVKTLVVRR